MAPGADRRGELRRGLRRTREHLFSHHEPDEYDRCYEVAVAGRTEHLCARCAGIYPGIAAGALIAHLDLIAGLHLAIAAIFPAPALLDAAATRSGDRRGRNGVRTATGLLLGCAYGIALPTWISTFPNVPLTAVGVVYGLLAAAVLFQGRRSDREVGRRH